MRYRKLFLGGVEMSEAALQVRLLGDFALSLGEERIDEKKSRSKKVWLLLAVLLYNHARVVSQDELIDLLWNDDKEGANPANALKTTLHRVRSLLDQLSPDAGHRMILRKHGGYTWNEEFPIWLDTREFEQLCRADEGAETDIRLERYLRALALYRGDFLGRMSSEPWVIPISTYYHNMYIQAARRALELMETGGRWEDAVELCRCALQVEPYQEDFYQHLMRNLLALGQQQKAATVYEEMSKLLLSNFGVMPDQESRALYREALRTVNRQTVPAGIVLEQLRETTPITGALVCDYDFFKMIYQAEARMVARSGDAVHIVLLSLTGSKGAELPRRSLDLAMDHMEEQIQKSLRKGDVVARCSPSQFIVMLPQANYENRCMVCQRVLRAFTRQYPHSPAFVQYSVHPLEPAPGTGWQQSVSQAGETE